MPFESEQIDFSLPSLDDHNQRTPPSGHKQNGTTKSTVVQPKPQSAPLRAAPSAILVSTRQKGNPLLSHIKSLPWEYTDTPADYVLGVTTCALFLSLKYHRLHPEYIYSRIRALGKLYNLRILLVMVDIENHEASLQELSKTSMINNLTLILAWSAAEAGRYVELFKSYEHASPSSIRAKQAESWQESLTEFVTTPRNINKTDAAGLISNFGSLRNAVNAQPEELALIPGWGEKKVRSWFGTLREPFRIRRTARTGAEVEGADEDVDERLVRRPAAIDIGTIPSYSRESTRPGTAGSGDGSGRNTPKDGHSAKKARLQEILPDEDVDVDLGTEDEAAMMAMQENEKYESARPATKVDEKAGNTSQRSDKALSAGVAAALAKYRQDSGG